MKTGFNVETGNPEKDTVLKPIKSLLLVGAAVSLLAFLVRRLKIR